MARVAYTDLFLGAVPTASTIPSITQIGAVITNLYKKAYSIMYGTALYSSDESTDTKGYIASDDCFAIIQSAASRICNQWQEAGVFSDRTEMNHMPKFDFNREESRDLLNLIYNGTDGLCTVTSVEGQE